MRPFSSLLLATAATFLASTLAQADPKVMTSIKPIHSLVAGVMDGIAVPGLVVDGAASPHTFSLRPSKARDIENAEIIFWVGPQMEPFLKKPVSNLGQRARIVQLDAATNLVKLPIRKGATFDEHDHDDHNKHHDEADHDDHDDHDKHHDEADHDDHDDHDKHHDEAGHDEPHSDEMFDAHLWLDTKNAKVLVREIKDALAEADPDNADQYASNAMRMSERLDHLETDIHAIIAPIKGKPFVVFHDAYHYFENRFEVPAAGSITLSPEIPPGAERIREIRDRVRDLEVACVFSEPQFSPSLISTVVENTNATAGVLDPLGTDLTDGPDLYFDLMRALATAMRDCLSTDN